MTRGHIRVTIIDDTRCFHCLECEGREASAEDAVFVAERLKVRFGDGVAVEYIDLASLPDHDAKTGLLAWVEANMLPLPVIAINDVPKLAGAVAYRPIAEAVETAHEVSLG